MESSGIGRLLAAFMLMLAPLALSACGGEETKAPEVKAPESVGEKEEAPAPLAPLPEPEPVEEVPVEIVDEEVPAEEPQEVPEEEAPAEEAPMGEGTEEVVELLSSNDEALIFFQRVAMETPIAELVEAFAEENYMHLSLTYIGADENLLAAHKDNIHFKHCPADTVEALMVASATNPANNYGMLIFFEEGKVSAYNLDNPSGELKLPQGFPKHNNNLDIRENMELIQTYIAALEACGLNFDAPEEQAVEEAPPTE